MSSRARDRSRHLTHLACSLLLLASSTSSCGLNQRSLAPVELRAQTQDLEAQTRRLNAILAIMPRDLGALGALGESFFAQAPPPEGLPLDLFRLSAIQCLNTPPRGDEEKSGPLRCNPESYPLLLRSTPPASAPWVTTQMGRIDAFRSLSLLIRARATKMPSLLEKLGTAITQHRIELERLELDLESAQSQYSGQNMMLSRQRLQAYRTQVDTLDQLLLSLTQASPTWAPEASQLTGAFLRRLVWLGLPQ